MKVQSLNLLKRCMSGNSLASVFYWTIYKRGDTEGKTLMGRSHTILKQYGLTLTKAIFNDVLESTTNLLYMNSTHTGKMDSLTLCVPFLMTLHSKTNAMPKCCCDPNFVLLF